VIERMIEKLPPENEGGWMVEPMRPNYGLPVLFNFAPRRDPETGMVHQAGEDMDFCLKWGEMGGQVWFDPDLTLHHIGKAKYSSNFWQSYTTKEQRIHGREGYESRGPRGINGRDREQFDEIVKGAAP
jgi:hypothetical protein